MNPLHAWGHDFYPALRVEREKELWHKLDETEEARLNRRINDLETEISDLKQTIARKNAQLDIITAMEDRARRAAVDAEIKKNTWIYKPKGAQG